MGLGTKRFALYFALFAALALSIAFWGCSSKEEKRNSFLKKGIKLYEAGDYKKAILEFKNTLQLDPNFAEGYLYLGKTYLRMGDPKKAYGSFSKALELKEDHSRFFLPTADRSLSLLRPSLKRLGLPESRPLS